MSKAVSSCTYNEFKKDLFCGDSRFMARGPDVIGAITLADCARGLQRIMCNDAMEVRFVSQHFDLQRKENKEK